MYTNKQLGQCCKVIFELLPGLEKSQRTKLTEVNGNIPAYFSELWIRLLSMVPFQSPFF